MEVAYDANAEALKVAAMTSKFNEEQKAVFEQITIALKASPYSKKCFFLYACGGCGKTFLLEALLAYVRSQNNIADKPVWRLSDFLSADWLQTNVHLEDVWSIHVLLYYVNLLQKVVNQSTVLNIFVLMLLFI